MGFAIGNQNAGVINNVERDQHVSGGQHGVLVLGQAREAAEALRVALDATELPRQTRIAAGKEVDEVAAELGKPAPDERRVGRAVTRLAEVLAKAGALGSAGSALVAPLTTLAHVVAPFAAGALHLLG